MDPRDPRPEWLDAADAVALLDIKRDTLYAYVSRGLVRRSGPRTARLYAREDLLRLKARHDARAGHGAVAAAALRWGEAVLDTAVSDFDADGPRYRTVPLARLLADAVPFEGVAALLWDEDVSDTPWPVAPVPEDLPAAPLDAFALTLARALPHDGDAAWTPLARARIAALAATLGRSTDGDLRAPALAARVAGPSPERAAAVDRALVIVAEHELNPSTFAARVAASAGAGLSACLLAATATMTGPRHGRMSDDVERLLDADTESTLVDDLRCRARRGEAVAGFGHPLYPQGDPRARHLFALADALGARDPRSARLRTVCEVLGAAGYAPPNLDAGLVALRLALRLPRGSAAGIFALGRAAGWTAHALEQRASPHPLRPRARRG